MLVIVHTQGFSLSRAINRYTEDKVRLAMALYRGKVQRAEVFLSDVNGPKGGRDMQCKIKIKANGFAAICAQDKAEDLYDAISACSKRARRAVEKRFDRVLQRRQRAKGYSYNDNDEAGVELQESDYGIGWGEVKF
tara:strand:- start:311 stop:718 length:408 start_codon:yes stop_codon:yes gene_type:complete